MFPITLPQLPHPHRTSDYGASASRRGIYLVAGMAAGLALGRRVYQPPRHTMPHRHTFQQALERRYGAVGAALLAARAQARYTTLYTARPRFAHPALRWHLTYQLLPGLALYQTLREHATKRGETPASALVETGQVLEHLDVIGPWLRVRRHSPFSFTLFRRVAKLSLALFPAEGWDLTVGEDSRQRLAFTISRCFYLDLLTAYGAPELTACYCHLDDVAYATLPPCVTWERTTTLGRGGAYCDFCWSAGTRAAGSTRGDAEAQVVGPR